MKCCCTPQTTPRWTPSPAAVKARSAALCLQRIPAAGRSTPLRWRPLTPALPLPAEVAMALPPLGPPSAAAVCVYIGREEPERWGRRGRSRLRRPPALHPLRAVRGETRHEGKVRRGAAGTDPGGPAGTAARGSAISLRLRASPAVLLSRALPRACGKAALLVGLPCSPW